MTDDSESALVKAIRARADAKEGSAQETESLARLEKLINDQDAMKDESKDLLGAAIFLVAWAHDAGIGERKVDLSLATELYRRGAKIGDVRCMSGLGSILLSDKHQVKEAYANLQEAAGAGDAEAMFNLGMMLLHGRLESVGKRPIIASAWFTKASMFGHPLATAYMQPCKDAIAEDNKKGLIRGSMFR